MTITLTRNRSPCSAQHIITSSNRVRYLLWRRPLNGRFDENNIVEKICTYIQNISSSRDNVAVITSCFYCYYYYSPVNAFYRETRYCYNNNIALDIDWKSFFFFFFFSLSCNVDFPRYLWSSTDSNRRRR